MHGENVRLGCTTLGTTEAQELQSRRTLGASGSLGIRDPRGFYLHKALLPLGFCNGYLFI